MNSKLILGLLFPMLLMYSCYKSTEWEDVTADYDPVLNVIGVISLDESIESFVEIYPTIDLTSLSMELVGYDSTFVYYTGKSGEVEPQSQPPAEPHAPGIERHGIWRAEVP